MIEGTIRRMLGSCCNIVASASDPGGSRTRDLRIKSPLLYQLSYRVGLIARRNLRRVNQYPKGITYFRMQERPPRQIVRAAPRALRPFSLATES